MALLFTIRQALLTSTCALCAGLLQAQDSIPPTFQSPPPLPRYAVSMQMPVVPAHVITDSVKPAAPQKNLGISGMPLLSFNRSRGVGFGAMGMAFFKLGEKPSTPPSRVILTGQYTTEKNWFVGAFSQLFLFEDLLRLSVGGGYMDSHFQTYESYGDFGEMEIPYMNKGFFFFASPLFRVYKKLYIGPGISVSRTDVTFDYPDGTTSTEHDYSNSLAASVLYDTKDNQYTPAKGFTSMLRYSNSPSWFKNDDAYSKIFFFTNYYHRIDKSKILASRVAMNVGLGDVPFAQQSYIGGKDIRGYTKGEYRGNQTYSAQTELRWSIYKRFGMVGFFGLAITADPTSQLLPGGGIGVRYKVLPKYNINAGIDGAVGKDDWGIYFRMTEAF